MHNSGQMYCIVWFYGDRQFGGITGVWEDEDEAQGIVSLLTECATNVQSGQTFVLTPVKYYWQGRTA